MDDAYRNYYRRAARIETAAERRYGFTLPPVDRAISSANREVGNRLREDAVQLLHVNLYEMVIAPIVAVRGSAAASDLVGDIEADVSEIVRAAGQRSADEISGHAVIDAVSRRWSGLRLMRPEVWG